MKYGMKLSNYSQDSIADLFRKSISYLIPHFTIHVISYLYWDVSECMCINGAELKSEIR